jgi:L-iditol 2-dehydrogenase
MNHAYPRAIRLVEQGRVDVTSVVTDRYPLSRAAEAFEAAISRTGMKVVVEPG